MNSSNTDGKFLMLYCSRVTQTGLTQEWDDSYAETFDDPDFPPCRKGNHPPILAPFLAAHYSTESVAPQAATSSRQQQIITISSDKESLQSECSQKLNEEHGLGNTNIINTVHTTMTQTPKNFKKFKLKVFLT